MSLLRPALALSIVAAATALVVPTAPASAAACPAWTKSQVARGYSLLENLAFDGTGGMLLSESSAGGTPGGVRRLAADGTRSTVVAPVTSPGGLVVDGNTLYFTSGNGLVSGLFNRPDGAINKVDLTTGATAVVATGLTMPNGMIQLPGGDLVVSRDLGKGSMTRVTPAGVKTPFATQATSTNGMAVDAAAGEFYVDSTFNLKTQISVIALDAPHPTLRTITIPGLGPLNSADDLTRGPDGMLYVALNVAGKVVRVDPATGAQCTVASGVPLVSSVRFGAGPGWDPASLYATSFNGSVTRLTPAG
jgi:sugar lactone lactonase YvrE